jgi:plasmid stabilization system protein ParE
MRLIVSEAAEADFARLHAFLTDKSPPAADRAIALIAAIQSLDSFPERGRPSGRPNLRELIVPFGQVRLRSAVRIPRARRRNRCAPHLARP